MNESVEFDPRHLLGWVINFEDNLLAHTLPEVIGLFCFDKMSSIASLQHLETIVFWRFDKALLYSPDCPRNYYIDQTGLELIATLLSLTKCSGHTHKSPSYTTVVGLYENLDSYSDSSSTHHTANN